MARVMAVRNYNVKQCEYILLCVLKSHDSINSYRFDMFKTNDENPNTLKSKADTVLVRIT